VGLVASPIRAAAVRDYLRDTGIAAEAIARLRSPVGLDIGATTPEEIALSILAELVAIRRGHHVPGVAPGASAGPSSGGVTHGARHARPEDAAWPEADAVDPVCGMTVERATARHIAEHGGEVYLFCSVGCRTRFVRDPAAFVPGP
jgi:xanthine dehydrogenase accessory factor